MLLEGDGLAGLETTKDPIVYTMANPRQDVVKSICIHRLLCLKPETKLELGGL